MMTKKRYLGVTALLAGLVCVGFLGYFVIPLASGPSVTKVNFDRIQLGMTKAEVQAILGEEHQTFPMGSCRVWCHLDGSAAVVVFARGEDVVGDKRWLNSTETVAQKLRRWFRLV
jgi:hypothetical protein